MQIFIIDTPIKTALSLDRRRFHNQITEAKLILKGIRGENGWGRHALAKMYKDHSLWLEYYIMVFEAVKRCDLAEAEFYNEFANEIKPNFLTEDFYNHMKCRLYTKDKEFYKDWEVFEESNINKYFVDGEWKCFIQK